MTESELKNEITELSESVQQEESSEIKPNKSESENLKKTVQFDDANEDDNSDDDEEKTKQKKAGVIYLSRIPTKMNVRIVRDYFSQFGEVDRIFLEPREKKRKNEQRSFSEGWVEFKRKKHAKQAALKLNNTMCGGKRKNPWYSELWNIKYLKKFRWTHLNERMAYEQELRKQRLRQEIQLAKKETNFYIQNVEKNERKKRLDKKNKTQNESETANKISNLLEENFDNDDQKFVNKRPKLYERKTKITGNADFLSQIFS